MYAIKLVKHTLFTTHPYGMDVLGEKETIEKIKREDIVNLYHKIFNPKNCVIAIWGDFNKKDVLKELKSCFSRWKPAENFLALKSTKESPIDKPQIKKEITEKKQAIVALGFQTVSIYDPHKFVFEVLENMLSGLGNRLSEKIRENFGLVYFVDAYNTTGLDTGYFIIIASTDKSNSERVKELIFEEIEKIKNSGFSNEELVRSKAYLIGRKNRSLQTKKNSALISSLHEIYGLGFDYYKDYEEKIGLVSQKEINSILETYFKDNNYVLVELLPKD
ncbi:MAG: insulinase family protein [Candidatus Omnitrophica bacterium]|nr:insulinase family protein [Candidatus Omnitrophota bacterium]